MDKTAVVILNWNGRSMLEKYIPTVLGNTDGAVIYVADNASTDDSLDMLSEKFPQVRQIVLDKNYGFADGYNKALRQVDAEYFVLLNSDVEVTPGWLQTLVDFMDENRQVVACQPKIRSVSNRQMFEYAGASGGFIDRYGYPFCRGRLFDTIEEDKGQYDDVVDVFWATGACMITRAQTYNEVGGLDGRFFAHSEEIDYCWRLKLKGYRVCCVPQSVVYHVGGGTLQKSNPRKTYLNFRNNLTMLYKNLPDHELKHVMFVRWFLDYVAAFEMLILGRNFGDFRAIYKARKDFHKWKHDFDKDRSYILQSAKDNNFQGKYSFLLLLRYYMKRQKKYSQLLK